MCKFQFVGMPPRALRHELHPTLYCPAPLDPELLCRFQFIAHPFGVNVGATIGRPAAQCYVFASVFGKFATSYRRAANRRPYIIHGTLCDKLKFEVPGFTKN